MNAGIVILIAVYIMAAAAVAAVFKNTGRRSP